MNREPQTTMHVLNNNYCNTYVSVRPWCIPPSLRLWWANWNYCYCFDWSWSPLDLRNFVMPYLPCSPYFPIRDWNRLSLWYYIPLIDNRLSRTGPRSFCSTSRKCSISGRHLQRSKIIQNDINKRNWLKQR